MTPSTLGVFHALIVDEGIVLGVLMFLSPFRSYTRRRRPVHIPVALAKVEIEEYREGAARCDHDHPLPQYYQRCGNQLPCEKAHLTSLLSVARHTVSCGR